MESKQKPQKKSFLSILGPGLISGAADDDPSGIATYTVVGAKSGLVFLWLSWFTGFLMYSVQITCARIGMVTGEDLTAGLQKKFSRPVMFFFGAGLFIANTFNVGADLAAMGDVSEMLTGGSSSLFILIFAVIISFATIRLKYQQISNVLKWLCISLFAYVITAFILKPDWGDILRRTFQVHLPNNKDSWSLVVAVLGTTISPYLFFWQAISEVEEKKVLGRITLEQRFGATNQELADAAKDVGVGSFFSNLVMYFIILAAALTLNKAGLTEIETSREAAEALKPIAGSMASWLYALGIIGTGFLAIPTLTGSSAYFLSYMQKWSSGLDKDFSSAKGFYLIVIISTVAAVAMDLLDINPLKALYWSAVINGILAPFILVGVIMVATDRVIMRGQPSRGWGLWLLILTTIFMFFAAGAFFFTEMS